MKDFCARRGCERGALSLLFVNKALMRAGAEEEAARLFRLGAKTRLK